jgi:hypothetical protein
MSASFLVGLTGCAELLQPGTPSASTPRPSPSAPAVAPVVPTAPPREEFVHPASDVTKEIEALTAKGFVAGPSLSRSLAAFEPVPVPQEKNMLFAIVVRLQPEAAWSPAVQAAGIRATFGNDTSCTPGVVGGGLVVARCQSIDKMTVSAKEKPLMLQPADLRERDYAKLPELGRGDAIAYVYSRPATEADIRRWTDQTQAFINAHSPAAKGARACQACRATFEDCRRTAGQGNCVQAYARCLPEAVDRKVSTWQLCNQPAP